MIHRRSKRSHGWSVAFFSAALVLGGCHSGNPGTGGNGGAGGSGGSGHAGSGGGGHGGMTGGGGVGGAPPAQCNNGTDGSATALDFSNNLLASPSPPGNLTPDNAPQIVVFGWDDIESDAGVMFVNSLLGSITNPDGKKGGANVNPNGCYAQGWADSSKYACGDGSVSLDRGAVTQNGFAMGNHTIDHLESNSTWSGIPAKYKDPTTMGWLFTDGFGPGIAMDQATWQTILMANDTVLKSLFGVSSILGFRGPRLEINDQGLKALKAINYTYDETLEETMTDNFVTAAVAADTNNKKGFNWVLWPYTLDNGSPGVWAQQTGNDKAFITDYPTGFWEIPVYQVYVPADLGTTIANTMLASDNPSNCTFPDWVPMDQRNHCYLGDGELSPGDSLKEVTSFDFNTFIYSRFTHDQWLEVMKHTFLMRYYGNRAPLTYGAHPIEYTDPYDSYTLAVQANNYGYRDVVKYNTYTQRQQAMRDFVAWIKNDPQLSKDTYFLSAKQLQDYMTKPFDKTGKPVAADAVASPDSNGIFSRVGWTGDGADIKVIDGNKADITFHVADVGDDPVNVVAGVKQGAFANLSHIDIKYKSDVPFRVRLLTNDGSPSMTVLLAGTGSDRTARIRAKDFVPGPETSADDLANTTWVNGDYLQKVSGIRFESAATEVTGAKDFTTHIEQITLHGVDSSALCDQ